MRNSTNYSLLLPDETDFYSVDDMNANTEIIDAQMKSNQTKADAVTLNHNNHVANKSNPHGVTKAQVGLSDVPNVATNNQTPTYTETSTLSALVSGEVLSTAFGKLSKAVSSLVSHLGNKSNPHEVTKAQIGLGSVENTSDANKPISTATQTALNLKADASNLTSHIGNTIMHITSAERSLWNSKADGVLLNNRIPQYFNVTTQAELDSVMNGHSANLAINSYYNFTLSVAVAGLSILGGTYYVEGMKTSAEYEWQRITKYPNAITLNSLLMMGRSKYAGVWTSWEDVITQTAFNSKVDKVSGKGLSTNDYTTAEKTKLAGIATGAQVNTITGIKGSAETSYRTGQVNLTAANIGLGNVNNTADSTKNVLSATKLTTPRTIALSGDVTGSVSFDGSGNANITATVTDDSHNHVISNVDGLQTALNNKADATVHLEVVDLQNRLADSRLSFGWADGTMELVVLIDGTRVGSVPFGASG